MGKQSKAIRALMIAHVEKAMIKISTRLMLRLFLDTPKDTGFAEANWVPQIGTTFTGTAGTRENAEIGIINRSQQLNGIDKISKGYKLKMGVINVTNNVDYIEDLNDGTSSKAPKAFVQVGIIKVLNGIG
jgi:hypothetical protein